MSKKINSFLMEDKTDQVDADIVILEIYLQSLNIVRPWKDKV